MDTQRMQIGARYLPINVWQLFGVVIKCGGYSIKIAQFDDEIKEKLTFPNSTIILLVSSSDMLDMRSFSIGGMKNQQDAILESFGTTEENIISLTRLPSTTYSFFPLLFPTLKISNFPLLLTLLNLRNYSE